VTSFLPSFSIHGPEADVNLNSTFVLVVVDPDAPTPQNRSLADVLHYMGGGYKVSGNISDHGFMLASNVTAVMPYFPPSPPNTSDPHRWVLSSERLVDATLTHYNSYAWLIYESTDAFASQTLVNPNTTRLGFDLRSFETSVGFGTPLGGTFFFVSTNPSQVGTSTGILTATPTTTPTTARASASASTTAISSGGAGGAGRIHLTASVFVVPLVALLL
jgi:hypothetical protein